MSRYRYSLVLREENGPSWEAAADTAIAAWLKLQIKLRAAGAGDSADPQHPAPKECGFCRGRRPMVIERGKHWVCRCGMAYGAGPVEPKPPSGNAPQSPKKRG